MTEAVWNTRKEAFNQPCFLHGMCAPYTSSLGNQQLHIIHMVCSFICCKLHNIQPAQQQGQTYTQYTLNQGSVLQPPPPIKCHYQNSSSNFAKTCLYSSRMFYLCYYRYRTNKYIKEHNLLGHTIFILHLANNNLYDLADIMQNTGKTNILKNTIYQVTQFSFYHKHTVAVFSKY